MACIEARGLRKSFGTTVALDGVDLRVEEGRILGIVGPNGAGKSTALNAILGLTPYQGELKVLGRDPWTERDRLVPEVSCTFAPPPWGWRPVSWPWCCAKARACMARREPYSSYRCSARPER